MDQLFWIIITYIGSPEMWAGINVALILGYWYYRKKLPKGRRQTFKAIVVIYTFSFWIAIGATFLLKNVFAVPRPCIPCTGGMVIDCNPFCTIDGTDSSYPSGHTAAAFAAVTPLAFIYKKGKWFLIIPILIGASRIALGVHTGFYVFGGTFLGIGTSLAGLQIYLRYFRAGKRR